MMAAFGFALLVFRQMLSRRSFSLGDSLGSNLFFEPVEPNENVRDRGLGDVGWSMLIVSSGYQIYVGGRTQGGCYRGG